MRTLLLLVLTALGLGGCASHPPLPACGATSIPYWTGASAWPQTPLVQRHYQVAHGEAARKVLGALAPIIPEVKETGPEPRFTSTEWWSRENARLARITQICSGCLPPPPVAVASRPFSPLPPMPILPNKEPELQGMAAQALP
jgi:hypothetical protein